MSECQFCKYCDLFKNKCTLFDENCYSRKGCLHKNCDLYEVGDRKPRPKIQLPTKVRVTNPTLTEYYDKIFNIAAIYLKKKTVSIGFSFSSGNYGNTMMGFADVEFVEFEEM